jgi:hypothetical protein
MELTPLEKSSLEFLENPVVAGITWQDATTYSQKGERVPTMFETTIGRCTITVMSKHVYHRGKWCFTCRELGFEAKLIGDENMTAQQAVTEAFLLCRRRVGSMYHAFTSGYVKKPE